MKLTVIINIIPNIVDNDHEVMGSDHLLRMVGAECPPQVQGQRQPRKASLKAMERNREISLENTRLSTKKQPSTSISTTPVTARSGLNMSPKDTNVIVVGKKRGRPPTASARPPAVEAMESRKGTNSIPSDKKNRGRSPLFTIYNDMIKSLNVSST